MSSSDTRTSRRRSRRGGRSAPPPGSPAAELAASKPGLRVRPVRPIRVLAGLLLVVAAVVAGLALYTRAGDRVEVLSVTRTVLAGERIAAGDVRVVSIGTDDEIPTVSAEQRDVVVGQYARVRLAAGSLLTLESVQARPLVDPDMVLMAVEVPAGQIPVGLREQSRVVLIIEVGSRSQPDSLAAVTVEATVVAVPSNLTQLVADRQSQSTVSLSVEVPPRQAALVGLAESVSIAVVDPSSDFSELTTSDADGDGETVAPADGEAEDGG